jgi:hypothetical protein
MSDRHPTGNHRATASRRKSVGKLAILRRRCARPLRCAHFFVLAFTCWAHVTARWASIVFTLIPSVEAASLLLRPSAVS